MVWSYPKLPQDASSHIVAQSLSEEAGAVCVGVVLGTIPLTSQPSACVWLNTKEHFVGDMLDGWGEEAANEAISPKMRTGGVVAVPVAEEAKLKPIVEVVTEGTVVIVARALQSKQPSS